MLLEVPYNPRLVITSQTLIDNNMKTLLGLKFSVCLLCTQLSEHPWA